jgi:hypothetical protein
MTAFQADHWHRRNRASFAAEMDRVRRYLDAHAGRPATAPPAPPVSMGGGAVSALDRLCEIFALSPFERDLLVLCAGVEADSGMADSCGAAHGDPRWTRPTVGLVLAALPGASWHALSPEATPRAADLIRIERVGEFVRSPIGVDEALLHYLLDGNYVDPDLDGIAEPLRARPDPPPEHHAAVARALAFWEHAAGRPPPLHLTTRDPGDGLTAAALLCQRAGMLGWRIDAAALPAAAAREAAAGGLQRIARRWRRLARLCDAIAVVEMPDETGSEAADAAFRFAETAAAPVVLVGRERRGGPQRGVVAIELPPVTAATRRALWRRALAPRLGAPPDAAAVARLAETFELDLAAIETAAAAVPDGASAATWLPPVWDACRQHARGKLDQLAHRVTPRADWDALVLPTPLVEMLRDLVAQARHRTRVHEEWNLGPEGQGGLGIAALFAGPSGTGKTLAAEVVAGALGLDLYRVDLAAVVSKFIGETEKNLARIFDAAEVGGAVLLFDEADALFGKRGEVKDSHDRYANIEVGYLLQRMESYRGLALLTTNLRDGLDQAFLRRLRFVLEFPFPDAALRARLWRVALPPTVPQRGVSAEALARLPLAGGQIRTVALNAAFLAAADGGVLTPAHLLTALRREYAKHGRALSDGEARLFA